MSQAYERLRILLGEIYDLERVGHLLAWDQETTMPPDGGPARAEQRATISRAAHERLVSAELVREGALGLGAWLEARRQRDFEVLRPHFERVLELRRRYIACFEPADDL